MTDFLTLMEQFAFISTSLSKVIALSWAESSCRWSLLVSLVDQFSGTAHLAWSWITWFWTCGVLLIAEDLFCWGSQRLMIGAFRWWLSICIAQLRWVPLLRYMSWCIVKKNVFSVDQKDPMLSDGSRRWSSSRFQTIRPATENARRPNLLRRWRGTIRWWRVADRRRWRLAMSDVGMQHIMECIINAFTYLLTYLLTCSIVVL